MRHSLLIDDAGKRRAPLDPSLWQLFTRPVARLLPYATPDLSVFICSASTPPGAGVHGMCGYYAAKAVLARRLA